MFLAIEIGWGGEKPWFTKTMSLCLREPLFRQPVDTWDAKVFRCQESVLDLGTITKDIR